MHSSKTYQINSPQVISEVVDGEAIILNFESGCYYSLNETGMLIWNQLKEGRDKSAILSNMRKSFDQTPDTLSTDFDSLLNALLEEQLLIPKDLSAAQPPALESDHSAAVNPYSTPELSKFSDLQELLLLDPIHDVDESGWPRQAE